MISKPEFTKQVFPKFTSPTSPYDFQCWSGWVEGVTLKKFGIFIYFSYKTTYIKKVRTDNYFRAVNFY